MRREAKGKGEKGRYIHLNAEFQQIARNKIAFLSMCVYIYTHGHTHTQVSKKHFLVIFWGYNYF